MLTKYMLIWKGLVNKWWKKIDTLQEWHQKCFIDHVTLSLCLASESNNLEFMIMVEFREI